MIIAYRLYNVVVLYDHLLHQHLIQCLIDDWIISWLTD